MGQSLQDQLLKAGIAKPKQANKARQDKARKNKAARRAGKQSPTEQQNLSKEVDAAQAAKRQADRRRAQAANAEREQRERKRRAIQIIQENRIAIETPEADEPPYSYTVKGKIRRLPVSREQRRRLASGGLAIVRYDGATSLVDTATAERLEALIPKAISRVTETGNNAPDPDDPYAGYEVPDDLMW
ncbi:DUF2058 domain-containing protein [Salinisphaera sp.]|uniref:DUF2058 domain-containing protein n=1 Tax=Salinisphaera sp. TaxID=1914330 RepID=UPI002D789994|nr:DUF2058 family protein [Salinisphaera sp.]HET7313406.1 DUF2058 family protein [Salinisphaera sp.]